MINENSRFFISYAREDSEFVLKLAKELRESGADLWLDQLDIRGGQRWDEAIQTALMSCKGILAVLSPNAVASQNFMDEVSYGLEEGKHIIPVLSQPCTIPFRLRRVQHVNFTSDYDKAFAELLKSLRVEYLPASAIAEERRPEGKTRRVADDEERSETGNKQNRKEGSQSGGESDPNQEKLEKANRDVLIGRRESTEETAAVPPTSSVEVRPTPIRERALTSLVAAIAGASIGTLCAFMWGNEAERNTWWIGAFLVGIPGAIAGAITGADRKVITTALSTSVLGIVICLAIFSTDSHRFLLSLIYGLPAGAIVGAIAGVLFKKYGIWK